MERRLSLEEAVEEIDIGGPCCCARPPKISTVSWCCPRRNGTAPQDELRRDEMTVGLEFRQIMASRAFEATSRYDALITSYLRP